ncbi:hypothetical protein [Bartonella machadoae]|uniref:hypothetical protein n=1 Tax=Bartonella machadoae TaxID=2893471 RepID=UPI0035698252
MWVKNSKGTSKTPLINRLNTKGCRNIGGWQIYIMMVLACTFISVKMVVLNGFYAILSTGAIVKWSLGALRDVFLKQARECATGWRSFIFSAGMVYISPST